MKDENKAAYKAAGLRILPICQACVAMSVSSGWGQCRAHDFAVPPNASCPDFTPRKEAYLPLGSFRDFLVDPKTLYRGEAKEEA